VPALLASSALGPALLGRVHVKTVDASASRLGLGSLKVWMTGLRENWSYVFHWGPPEEKNEWVESRQMLLSRRSKCFRAEKECNR
jgi:hypothetical protein